jgi:CheY-like chemotaxis protein
MQDLQTATVDSTGFTSATAIVLPLVLVADADAASRARRADQLRDRGFRVVLARTPFEAIVKASCQLPDVILVDSALANDGAAETAELLSTCPATAHIPIIRLTAGRRLPTRILRPRR